MLNGITYIVRPRHAATEHAFRVARIFRRISPIVGRAGVFLGGRRK
jgi:hypothetical protein